MITTQTIRVNSLKGINKLAVLLAGNLSKLKTGKAAVLALSGDLGTGKTAFVRYFLRALGVKQRITSPTFVITKSYKLKTKNYKTAYHIDCYRIKNPRELFELGLKEILENLRNIVLIEWPEKVEKILPSQIIWLNFRHGTKERERIIQIIKIPKSLSDSIKRYFRSN